MENYYESGETLLKLFNGINRKEEKAVISGEFRDISNNDMHIIDAIGIGEPRSMSAVARDLSVTVGTLTIAINNLVKKSYVKRVRSEKDRRVVLVSLLEKGKRAYRHHKDFHDAELFAIMGGLDEDQAETLIKALTDLDDFFMHYGK
ncbi:MAG: MarR family winged helix-turn-helix transcriptional regulator [Clostridiales bacterium]|nr:MarR family winged helix-turn-helix transcriptional regulator [Clostridiales bacterium]